MKKELFKEIEEHIMASHEIVITTHINPDGDGIGAGIALILALNKYIEKNNMDRTNIRFVIEDKIPDNLQFLFGAETIELYQNFSSKKKIDLLLALDIGSLERMGKVKDIGGKLINIDHHVSNTKFGDINYIDETSPSTAEIIFDFINHLGIEIDLNMGEALYTGIVNDTGNFRHSNVTEATFLKAAYLRKIGVNNTKIIREFYYNKKFSGLKLYGVALERSQLVEDKKFIYSYITQKDLKEFSGDKFSTEGLVEFLLQCNQSDISLFLREEENGTVKGSMRTIRDDYDLNNITKIFGGGGHKKAAGFSSKLKIDEIIKKIMEIL